MKFRELACTSQCNVRHIEKEHKMANSSNQGNQGGRGGSQSDNKQSDNRDGSSNRGFASMDPDKQREIAAEGGRAAHASGHAHEFTSEEAREAGSMSHKNDGNQQSGSGSSRGGGSQQSGGHGGGSNQQSGSHGGSGSGGMRGGTPEQHAEAGRQSHKNDKK
jgi:hypothetical protein